MTKHSVPHTTRQDHKGIMMWDIAHTIVSWPSVMKQCDMSTSK